MSRKIIECVPNISEGRDRQKIDEIARVVESVEGVRLLDVDPGKATNRTVITFVGEPQAVTEAAFRLVARAKELIDMRQHHGAHPRFGATDVCPLVPVSGIDMDETVQWARRLGQRIGEELGIPVYLYEKAATRPEFRNLATVRKGEYEGLREKLSRPDTRPDFGPGEWNDDIARSGAIAVGARDFLVAYNVNLNTTSTRRANAIAFDIREAGRLKREGNPLTGPVVKDQNGQPVRIPGKFKGVKGIGWYIEEYGIAQVSYNITDINLAPVHRVFDETDASARRRGVRVTGSEIVGLVPKKVLLDAADYFLRKQQRSLGIPEKEKIKIAVKSLGLDDLKPFRPEEKVIEYLLDDPQQKRLIDLSLQDFADSAASESPAPGGGSVSAYIGALGAALGTMVANLSAHKRGWDERWEFFSDWAVKGEAYKQQLMALTDEDTRAFNRIMEAFRMPKKTAPEQEARRRAIEEATLYAMQVPLKVMQTALDAMEVPQAMAREGLPASVSDAAVGALALRTAAQGAFYNVLINARELTDRNRADALVREARHLLDAIRRAEADILATVETKMSGN